MSTLRERMKSFKMPHTLVIVGGLVVLVLILSWLIPSGEFSRVEKVLPDGKRVPDGISVWNPAFDVTPAALITAIINETGVYRAPYDFSR